MPLGQPRPSRKLSVLRAVRSSETALQITVLGRPGKYANHLMHPQNRFTDLQQVSNLVMVKSGKYRFRKILFPQ